MIIQEAVDLIKHYEGFRADPYQDMGGIWTQGYGFTGAGINENSPPMLQEEADTILNQKINYFEGQVRSLLDSPTTDNQLGALVSLVYNIGITPFASSTLLSLHNAAEYEQAKQEFSKWNHVNGQVVGGLTLRRCAEALLYAKQSNVII